MSSTATTYINSINTNYPVPGVDNDTQGFRDNYSNIKSSLTTLAGEIGNLQLTSVVTDQTNNFNYQGYLYKSVLSAHGVKINNLGTLGSDTEIDFLQGNYQIADISASVTFSFANWPSTGVEGKIILEIRNSSSNSNSINFANSLGSFKKPTNLFLPYSVSSEPVFFEIWSKDQGVNVYINKISDFSPFASTGTSVYDAETARIVTSSTQLNITAIGTLTNLSIGQAGVRVSNDNIIFSNVSGITIETNETVPLVLSNWSGGIGSIGTISTLTFTSVNGINVGDTFKLWSAETGTHTVKSVDAVSKTVTTDPFNTGDAVSAGVVAGSNITFKIGLPYSSLYYAGSRPTTNVGRSGDRKGGIYADSDSIFVSTKDYNGSIMWVETYTTSSVKSLLSIIENTVTNNVSRLDNLETIIGISTSSAAAAVASAIASANTVTSVLQTVNSNTNRIAALEATGWRDSGGPFNNYGAPGDKQGMFYSTTDTLYVCIQDYVGTGTPIWVRYTGGYIYW